MKTIAFPKLHTSTHSGINKTNSLSILSAKVHSCFDKRLTFKTSWKKQILFHKAFKAKGSFYSESVIRFFKSSNLQKNIPNYYPELEL